MIKNQCDGHLLEHFYIIAVISNPARYASRYALYEKFREHMVESGVKLITVEISFGDREHKIVNADNHIRLYTNHELWHKENMINLAVSRLPVDWQYVAWIDADISFIRKDWALETVNQLQHYKVVQLFQTAIDLGPTGEAFSTYHGFAWCHVTGQPYPKAGKHYPYFHPGYCWAATREAFDCMGGLIDFAALGAADHHMAMALIGKAKDSIPKDINKNYCKMVLDWGDRVMHSIKSNIGFVPGTIVHHFHGKKKDRKYWDRWKILIDNDFDPSVDIFKDSQGLYQLTSQKPKLRDELRQYFRSRNEDSIDLE